MIAPHRALVGDGCTVPWAAATRRLYTRYTRELLVTRFGAGDVDLRSLGPAEIIDFISEQARERAPETALRAAVGGPARSLRSLDRPRSPGLRHDALHGPDGIASRGGRRALARRHRLASGHHAAGTRQRATDERPATASKGGSSGGQLPAERPAADAGPPGLRTPPGTVGRAVDVRQRRRCRALRVRPGGLPSQGAHVLRHTAATRMVRAGASLKEVADVLRHRSIDSVMIYTKLDLPRRCTR